MIVAPRRYDMDLTDPIEDGGETAGEAIRERKLFADSEGMDDSIIANATAGGGGGGGPLLLQNVSTPEVIGNRDKIPDPLVEINNDAKERGKSINNHHNGDVNNIPQGSPEGRSPLDLPDFNRENSRSFRLFHKQNNDHKELTDEEGQQQQQQQQQTVQQNKKSSAHGCGPYGCTMM